MSYLGDKIKKLREKKGMSLSVLASEVDIPASCLEDVEKGRKYLGIQTLKKLADVLNVDEDEFIKLVNKTAEGEKIEKDSGEYISNSAGRKLRQVREERGLTLVECGKKAGISYTHISEIERGNVCPSLKTLEKLANALEKPLSYFLKGDTPVTLGEKLRKLREAQGLTQVKIASQVGISDSLIAQIETGKVQPSLNTLEKLADTFGVSVDYFLSNPQENSLEGDNIVSINEIATHKKSRNRTDLLEDTSGWQQELAVGILNLINEYVPNQLGVPEDPITEEIVKRLKELTAEKKQSVLDYIKFMSREEDVQANY